VETNCPFYFPKNDYLSCTGTSERRPAGHRFSLAGCCASASWSSPTARTNQQCSRDQDPGKGKKRSWLGNCGSADTKGFAYIEVAIANERRERGFSDLQTGPNTSVRWRESIAASGCRQLPSSQKADWNVRFWPQI
jgi:hypothetical protein